MLVDGRRAREAGSSSVGAGEGDGHLRRPGGDVVLVRRFWSAACVPLRHLSIDAVGGVVEVSRLGAVAGEEPPLRQKAGVTRCDEALTEAVDGAPLGEHIPTLAQDGGAARNTAARRVAAVGVAAVGTGCRRW